MYSVIHNTITDVSNEYGNIGGVDDSDIHMKSDAVNNVGEVMDDGMWDNSTKYEMVHKLW